MYKLLLPLLLTPFAFAYTNKIEVIDYDADTNITIFCIDKHAFAQYGKTALVPLMTYNSLGITPKTCKQYKK